MSKTKRRKGGLSGTGTTDCQSAANAVESETIENDRQLHRLAIFLEDAVGFRLGLVTYDTPEIREQQLARLAERLHDTTVHLTRLDLTDSPHEEYLLDRLRAHLDRLDMPDGRRPAVMVTGIESALDYRRLGPETQAGLALLDNANVQRDAFARFCPFAVVLWLNPTATSALAVHAPDLWHWRNGTFRFTGPVGSRKVVEQRLTAMPLLASDNLLEKDKLERIAMLRDLLAEQDSSPTAGTPRERQRRASLLAELGSAYLSTDDPRRAMLVLEECIAIARDLGNRRGEGNALGVLGVVYHRLGDMHKAIECFEEAFRIARETGDRRGQGSAMGNLGNAFLSLGDLRRAIECYEQQLGVARELGDRLGESNGLGNLGLAYSELGHARQAIDLFEQALAIDREIGNRRGEGADLGNLGNAYRILGDIRRAIEHYELSLRIASEIGNQGGVANVLGNLGNAHVVAGDLHRAIEYYEQSLLLAREMGDRSSECATLANLGNAWSAMGGIERARDYLTQGLQLALSAGDRLRIAQLARSLARVDADSGDTDTAVALAAFTFSEFRAMDHPQARTAAEQLNAYREQLGAAKFRNLLTRAEQIIATRFREFAEEEGAAVALPAFPTEAEVLSFLSTGAGDEKPEAD